MSSLNELKRQLKPGQVYCRADLAQWSNAVDRHLKQLVKDGTLQKVYQGVYACPRKASFGKAAPEDCKLVEAFLKTNDFLLFSPNAYNSLGVGTTQLYNEQVVYNWKRHGKFKLGNRTFIFQVKPYFPKELSKEFLLVDLVNNISRLAEEEEAVLERVSQVAASMNISALKKMIRRCGGARAVRLFASINEITVHPA
ncbi:hypothetical protein [Cellvibrio sp. NN19]|uniref:hypothetical protein n=1 Tax=Cellvibrio chitinivorans TaxID=3102792 RepID=UPI002B412DED|nr:hypothetical protein [Cellvibrio sp. NN19]